MRRKDRLGIYLKSTYPLRHMRLYNAAVTTEDGADLLAAYIKSLLDEGKRLDEIPVVGNKYFKSAIGIIQTFYRLGLHTFLHQIKKSVHKEIPGPFSCIVLQESTSDRWFSYGAEEVRDIVLAVPELSRVAALSIGIHDRFPSSEEETSSILDSARIENVYFYPFFNRIHGVSHRRMIKEGSARTESLERLQFLLHPCKDINQIGRSCQLNRFVPITTNEGFRLGFFFATVVKINDITPVKTDFGFSPDEFNFVISDFSGSITLRCSYQIFRRSIEDGLLKPHWSEIDDPTGLLDYHEWYFLFVGCWFFGYQIPYTLYFFPLSSQPENQVYELLAFLNSRKKMDKKIMEKTQKVFEKEIIELFLKNKSVYQYNEQIYYRPQGWSDELLRALIDMQKGRLLVYDRRRELDRKIVDLYLEKLCPYLWVNPDFDKLYHEDDVFEQLYPSLEDILSEQPGKEVDLSLAPKGAETLVPVAGVGKHEVLECPICYGTFLRPGNFTSHFNKIHDSKIILVCGLCGKRLSPQIVSKHFLRVHSMT